MQKKEKNGKSQCKKIDGKNVRVMYIYQTAFGKQLDTILKGRQYSLQLQNCIHC